MSHWYNRNEPTETPNWETQPDAPDERMPQDEAGTSQREHWELWADVEKAAAKKEEDEQKAKLDKAKEVLEATKASMADMQRMQKNMKDQILQQQREWDETQTEP